MDWWVNFNCRLVETDGVAGRVHAGFLDSIESLDLGAFLELRKTRTSHVVGHSLGGALALLLCAKFGIDSAVTTFGSPRVGDAAFSAGTVLRADSYVIEGDLFTQLAPKWLGYADNPGNRIVVAKAPHQVARVVWHLPWNYRKYIN